MSLLTELELIRMANYKDVAPDGAGEKRRRAAAVQDAAANSIGPRMARSVLECASPLALSEWTLVKIVELPFTISQHNLF
jgi:hypothetical protein